MNIEPIEVTSIKPLRDNVIVADMNFEERVTNAGLILRRDDTKLEGVRPRWGLVFAVGPEQKDIKVGEWVLVAHGRWTRGIKIKLEDGTLKTIRRIDINDLLAVTDVEPLDETMGRPL